MLVQRIDRGEGELGEAWIPNSGMDSDVGELSGVEVDLLKTAFDTFRERTICEDAELAIDSVGAAWACPSCERAITRGAVLRCDTCGRPARMIRGDEIILERIEMEAPDV